MPMLSDEQKRQLDQAKMHLDFDKMNLEQQDKVNGLLLKIQEAVIKQNDWTAAREDRKQAHEDSMGLRGALLSVAQDRLAMEQQKAADEHQKAIDEHQKFVAEQNAKGPPKKLPPGLQANLTALQKRATSITSQLDTMSLVSDPERKKLLQSQLDETNKQIDDLRAQAEKLDAQGAPTQPPPSQGSGNPATANIPQTPIPAETPPGNISPALWATLVPEQKKAYRDYWDGMNAGGNPTTLGNELNATLAEIQKKLDKQKKPIAPLGQ
jgi:hypothetical protein